MVRNIAFLFFFSGLTTTTSHHHIIIDHLHLIIMALLDILDTTRTLDTLEIHTIHITPILLLCRSLSLLQLQQPQLLQVNAEDHCAAPHSRLFTSMNHQLPLRLHSTCIIRSCIKKMSFNKLQILIQHFIRIFVRVKPRYGGEILVLVRQNRFNFYQN